MTNIAVISDIHGNYTAFKAVYDDIKNRPIDYIIFLGDLICDFPLPEDTFDLIYKMIEEYPCTFVAGNKEEYMFKEHSHWSYCSKNGSLLHTYNHLRKKDLNFIKSFPQVVTFKPYNCPEMTIMHGHTIRSEQNYETILKHLNTSVLLFGHTHERFVLNKNGILLLNPGGVGTNKNPKNNIAEYAILTFDNNQYVYEMVDVVFDVEKEKQRIIESNFLKQSRYWGAASYKSLDTGKIESYDLIHLATKLANGNKIEECHFEKAAMILDIPLIE